jgi:phenylacetate-coenzyme A ligase PaaK-like adenylate-forming protein
MGFAELETLLKCPLYTLSRAEREPFFLKALREVALHHYRFCEPYQRLCQKRGFDPETFQSLEELPYFPTSLFKDLLILSVPPEAVFREIKSSATTTGRSSLVGLDRETSQRQSKCFTKMVVDRLGNKRYRFIVLDEPSTISRSAIISARSSTIRSLLFCAKEAQTCVNEDHGKLSLDEEKLDGLLRAGEEQPEEIAIFGFTFILYFYVVRKLLESGKRYHLPGAKVLHIGGWKKLEAEKVTPEKLIDDCCELFGVFKEDVVDFYGFTEQAGLIYPTCEAGLRHTPVFAEILVRDPLTLKSLPPDQEGLLQFISPIQTSYPGHSVLTEDLGVILGMDDCKCGRKGTLFKMVGRAREAEFRGCGDIMADQFA